MIHVKTEEERIRATLRYINICIEEINQEINACDYEEDADGNVIYSPDCYASTKNGFETEKRKLEIIRDLLTQETPFSILEW